MNERVIRALAAQMSTRIGAARHGGLDCVRLTLAEAQVVRAILPGIVAALDAAAVDARKGER